MRFAPNEAFALAHLSNTSRSLPFLHPLAIRQRCESTARIDTGRTAPDLPYGLLLGGLSTAIIGVMAIACTVLGLSQLYVGAYTLGVALRVAATIGALTFRSAFNWHRHRLEAD